MSVIAPPRLELRGVRVRFGGLAAVDGVDLVVGAGESIGLIGPNGAGKSTLLGAISGRVRTEAGDVLLDGRTCLRREQPGRVRHGIASTFQRTRTLAGVTARELVEVASAARTGADGSPPEAYLDRAGLLPLADAATEELTPAQTRFLDMARALACRPSVLLVDEPFAALDAADAGRMRDLLSTVHAGGTSVVLVEHRLDELVRAVSRVVVLVAGRVTHTCRADELLSREDCLLAYLGMVAGA